MTADCKARPQNSPRALNMPLARTAHSSNPFGGCAMAVREPGQPPSRGGVPAAEDRQVLRPEGRLHGIDAFDRPLLVVRHFYRPRELERRSKKISAY
jgi:hypothetical protein